MTIVRYFFVGSAAAAVDFILFAFLTLGIGIPWFPAAIVSFVAATAANYVLSVRHVFKSRVRFSRKHEVQLVFFVSLVGLTLNQLFLWLLIETFQFHILLSKIIATVGVFAWNYGARKHYIFRAVSRED